MVAHLPTTLCRKPVGGDPCARVLAGYWVLHLGGLVCAASSRRVCRQTLHSPTHRSSSPAPTRRIAAALRGVKLGPTYFVPNLQVGGGRRGSSARVGCVGVRPLSSAGLMSASSFVRANPPDQPSCHATFGPGAAHLLLSSVTAVTIQRLETCHWTSHA